MNTSNNLRLWRSAVLLGSLIGVTSQTVHGQEPYTKDAITKAWASREQKVKNAKFRYEGEKTVTKGSLSWILSVPGKTATPIAKDAVVPPTDSTFPVSATVSFDMSRLRFTLNTQHWSWEKNSYSPATTTTSFDGKTSKVLDDAWVDCAWPIGQIRTESTNIYAGLSQLRPILMTFRPFVANMRAYDLGDFELTKRKARIGDTECLELYRITDDGRQTRLWVDPARDFVIVRFLESRGDVVQLKIDVRYTSHPTIRWFPKNL